MKRFRGDAAIEHTHPVTRLTAVLEGFVKAHDEQTAASVLVEVLGKTLLRFDDKIASLDEAIEMLTLLREKAEAPRERRLRRVP